MLKATSSIISASQIATPINVNLVMGNGFGIDFSATPGTGTSELLNDYEEGTWTGTLTSTTPPSSAITATGKYTKIGRQVTIQIEFSNVNTTGGAGAISITGLPFTSSATPAYSVGPVSIFQFGAVVLLANIAATGTIIGIVSAVDATASSMPSGPNRYLYTTITYTV